MEQKSEIKRTKKQLKWSMINKQSAKKDYHNVGQMERSRTVRMCQFNRKMKEMNEVGANPEYHFGRINSKILQN